MLAHDRTGSGPPLLLLHGLGSCKEMWRPVVPMLAQEREVIAVDLPGFGASPAGAQTVDAMADEVGRSPTASGSTVRTWPATRWAAAWRWRSVRGAGCARHARSRRSASRTRARPPTRAACS